MYIKYKDAKGEIRYWGADHLDLKGADTGMFLLVRAVLRTVGSEDAEAKCQDEGKRTIPDMDKALWRVEPMISSVVNPPYFLWQCDKVWEGRVCSMGKIMEPPMKTLPDNVKIPSESGTRHVCIHLSTTQQVL